MANVILRRNATPLYAFLSLIQDSLEEGETI